ncbi:MAG: aldehyde dehydrogenase family protein [Candidatus Eisenbacteria bacterium]|uniref:Aldehyde dehydrogenase family protein n=1 Tax=Eiseniibacteriota bacterium TaxID=2212470 RepID=A0A7Y2H3J0_UNCEI|nr:aldehyde dehydrogenase family protein [Candidatus Eisenbacteria bacterium]
MKLESDGRLFIGGEWEAASSGETFESINPATEEVIGSVASGDEADVDRAVKSARSAFEGKWSAFPPAKRAALLQKLAGAILKNRDAFAAIEVADQGKVMFEASKIDVPMAADAFNYYAGWATKLGGSTIPNAPGMLNYVQNEPFGVVGQIIPWNFPLLMAAWKLAPALAAGNTVVLKPAEQTPLSAIKLGQLIEEVGFPPGVVNIVTGFGPTAGAELVAHPDVDRLSFTGSTEVGKGIMRTAADSLTPVTLELGGKSPNIVFADANLDAASRGAITGIFYNKGEACTAGSRLFVEDSIADEFIAMVLDRARKSKPGDPTDMGTKIGPLVSAAQRDRVEGYVKLGQEEGANLALGGKRAEVGDGRGYFYEPTVLTVVSNTMRVAQEEIFGPVLSIIRFKEVEEVVLEANQNPYGLAAGVWTNDLGKAHRTAAALNAGTVWINTYGLYSAAVPFGGTKASGFGRELGEQGVRAYTRSKSVWVSLG